MADSRWAWPLPGHFTFVPTDGMPGAFMARRSREVHTGVDLYAPEYQPVHAVEAGRIVLVEEHFTGPESGSPWWLDTSALLIEGESGVVCYGEIEVEFGLCEGMRVERGQKLGMVVPVLPADKGNGRTMLHLELYESGFQGPAVTWPLEDTRPEMLLDPTRYLEDTNG